MSEKLTPKQRIEQAIDMVHALCQPRGSGRNREWIMSIPARPDYDPDLVIASGLRAGEDALAELARLREQLALVDTLFLGGVPGEWPDGADDDLHDWERWRLILDGTEAGDQLYGQEALDHFRRGLIAALDQPASAGERQS